MFSAFRNMSVAFLYLDMAADSFPLKTSRLWLKKFVETDLHYVFQGLSHPSVIRYYGVNFESLEETKSQMQWFDQLEREETGIWWAVYSSDGLNFLGGVGFNNLSKDHKKAEIGFWLLPEYWGMGLMQEATELAISYAFDILQIHRIEAIVECENKNSLSLLNKLNFRLEGTLQDYEIKNGAFITVKIYAKFNSTY